MNIAIEGALAANLSRILHIPVTATYEYPDEGRSAILKGVVVEPAGFFASDPKQITSKTDLVVLRGVTRTEKGPKKKEVIREPNRSWLAHTSLITLRIGRGS